MTSDVAGLQFKTGELSGREVIGSAIHVDGKLAIVATLPMRPYVLAIFDSKESRFTLVNYQRQTVLLLGNELMFEPDLTVPSEYRAPGPSSQAEVYYDGSGLYVRVHQDQAPQASMMLDLATGKVDSYPTADQKAHVFRRWRLGVRGDGRVTWVLAVGGQLPAWSSEVLPPKK